MDMTGKAFVEAIEPYGLTPLLLIGIVAVCVAILCLFVLPVWKEKMRADADTERMRAEAEVRIEESREKRKADELQLRDEREQERAEIDTRTTVILEGLKASIDALKTSQDVMTAQIEASKVSSRKMGETVEDTNRKVDEIHHIVVMGGRNA